MGKCYLDARIVSTLIAFRVLVMFPNANQRLLAGGRPRVATGAPAGLTMREEDHDIPTSTPEAVPLGMGNRRAVRCCRGNSRDDLGSHGGAIVAELTRDPRKAADARPGDVLSYRGKAQYRVVRREGEYIVDTPVDPEHPDFGDDLYHDHTEWELFYRDASIVSRSE